MVQSQNRMQQIPLSSYVQKCSNYKKKWHQSRHHSALSYSLHLLGLQVIYIQTAWQWQVVIQTACQWHILINIQHDKSTSIGLPHSRQTVWHAQLKYFVKKKKKIQGFAATVIYNYVSFFAIHLRFRKRDATLYQTVHKLLPNSSCCRQLFLCTLIPFPAPSNRFWMSLFLKRIHSHTLHITHKQFLTETFAEHSQYSINTSPPSTKPQLT